MLLSILHFVFLTKNILKLVFITAVLLLYTWFFDFFWIAFPFVVW